MQDKRNNYGLSCFLLFHSIFEIPYSLSTIWFIRSAVVLNIINFLKIKKLIFVRQIAECISLSKKFLIIPRIGQNNGCQNVHWKSNKRWYNPTNNLTSRLSFKISRRHVFCVLNSVFTYVILILFTFRLGFSSLLETKKNRTGLCWQIRTEAWSSLRFSFFGKN